MVELRWVIKERHYTTWDDRWDKEVEHSSRAAPVLQYREDYTTAWINVPTVVEVTNE